MKRQVDGTTQRRGTIPGFDDLFSPRGLLRSLRHKLIVFRRTAARQCICRQTAQCGMSATCSPAVRPLVHDDSDEHASRVRMTRPLVSPYRRECRSAGQALDARGPLCLFRESRRARFWSPFRRKPGWLCVRRKHVHRRHDRATIGRHSRYGKSRAGDRTSRPPRDKPTATRIRSLRPASPRDSFSALAGGLSGQPSGQTRTSGCWSQRGRHLDVALAAISARPYPESGMTFSATLSYPRCILPEPCPVRCSDGVFRDARRKMMDDWASRDCRVAIRPSAKLLSRLEPVSSSDR